MIRRAGHVWLGRLVLLVLVPPLLLELLLQAGALIVAARAPEPPSAASIAREPCAVLCVGDSYTYGLGATNAAASYPSLLESRLRQQPIDGRSRVVNAGWPGRNSRAVLESFAQQFLAEPPLAVVVLVGVNDLWSLPRRFELVEPPPAAPPPPPEPRFRFELRLPRLLELVFPKRKLGTIAGEEPGRAVAAAKGGGARATSPQEALVGRWRCGGQLLELRSDGTASVDGSALRWSIRRKQLLFSVASPESSQPMVIAFRLDGDRLHVVPPGASEEREFVRDSAPAAARAPTDDCGERIRAAILRHDDAEAFELANAWVLRSPENPAAHAARVDAASHLGRHDIVEPELDWLRRRREMKPGPDTSSALLAALKVANLSAEARAVATRDVEQFPDCAPLWMTLADVALAADDAATAERAITRSLELAPGDIPSSRGWKLRARAHARSKLNDWAGAMRDVLASYLADHDDDAVRQWARLHRCADAEALLDGAAADLDPDGSVVGDVRRLFVEAADPAGGGALDVLQDHLRQLVEFSRRHGAQVIVASYPFRSDLLERVQRGVAEETNQTYVDLRARFDALAHDHSRAELFVEDGHCTDLGYRFVCDEIEAALRVALAPPAPASAVDSSGVTPETH
jgi:lysophospholipase L1-like esterase